MFYKHLFLFLVCINDLTENMNSNIILFVDDTSLFMKVQDHDQSVLVLYFIQWNLKHLMVVYDNQ